MTGWIAGLRAQRGRAARTLLSLVLSLSVSTAAFAGSYTWSGAGGNSNFSNPANWTPAGGPPKAGDSATIPAGSTVKIDVAVSIGSLVVLGPFTTILGNPNISITATDSILIAVGVQVTAGNGPNAGNPGGSVTLQAGGTTGTVGTGRVVNHGTITGGDGNPTGSSNNGGPAILVGPNVTNTGTVQGGQGGSGGGNGGSATLSAGGVNGTAGSGTCTNQGTVTAGSATGKGDGGKATLQGPSVTNAAGATVTAGNAGGTAGNNGGQVNVTANGGDLTNKGTETGGDGARNTAGKGGNGGGVTNNATGGPTRKHVDTGTKHAGHGNTGTTGNAPPFGPVSCLGGVIRMSPGDQLIGEGISIVGDGAPDDTVRLASLGYTAVQADSGVLISMCGSSIVDLRGNPKGTPILVGPAGITIHGTVLTDPGVTVADLTLPPAVVISTPCLPVTPGVSPHGLVVLAAAMGLVATLTLRRARRPSV